MTRSSLLRVVAATLALATLPAPPTAGAQGLLQRLRDRDRGGLDDDAATDSQARLPASVRAIRDVAYGADKNQRFDVYVPASAEAGRCRAQYTSAKVT